MLHSKFIRNEKSNKKKKIYFNAAAFKWNDFNCIVGIMFLLYSGFSHLNQQFSISLMPSYGCCCCCSQFISINFDKGNITLLTTIRNDKFAYLTETYLQLTYRYIMYGPIAYVYYCLARHCVPFIFYTIYIYWNIKILKSESMTTTWFLIIFHQNY